MPSFFHAREARAGLRPRAVVILPNGEPVNFLESIKEILTSVGILFLLPRGCDCCLLRLELHHEGIDRRQRTT